MALSGAPPATDPHRPTAEHEGVALIRRSLALGLTYLDTAPMYGVGQSEARYGRALRGVPRDDFVLSTKAGRVLRPGASGGQPTWAFDFSAAGVRASFESSLGRLGLERVDILFDHDPDDHHAQAVAEAFPVLMELRAQGRVKAIGAGMNQWQMELDFARRGFCDCFLLAGRYTLLDQSALPEFLPYCLERRIAVVAGGPYNSGILAVGPREGATYNYRPADAEMMVSDPKGFRTTWQMALVSDGSLKYQYNDMMSQGQVAIGQGWVYEGDGRWAIVLTRSDGSAKTTVSKPLP